MIQFDLTREFRHFLYILSYSIRLNQNIGIYYNISHINKEKANTICNSFRDIFKLYPNVIFFYDYVPGFLTNPDGVSTFSKKPNFTFIFILNFNYTDSKHRSLLDELIVYKIEYILISSSDMDLVAYVPFLFLQLDLNDLTLLNIFQFYLASYLKINNNNKVYHNLIKTNSVNFNVFLFNLLFLWILLSKDPKYLIFYFIKVILRFVKLKKKILNNQKFLKKDQKILTYRKYKKTICNNLKNLNLRFILTILLYKTNLKKKLITKYFKYTILKKLENIRFTLFSAVKIKLKNQLRIFKRFIDVSIFNKKIKTKKNLKKKVKLKK